MNTAPGKKELFDYYNERASEYEEFTDGGYPVDPVISAIVAEEINTVKRLVPDYISGRCIDIACGTGFWLPVYENKCSEITLIDQSENVLNECNKKIYDLGLKARTEVIQDDIFTHGYTDNYYDSIFCGYLISHLDDDEIDDLIYIFKRILVPGGRFIISDKVWGETRQAVRREKKSIITRTIKNGRQFDILNRMFEKTDLHKLAKKHNFNLEVIFWGKVFFLISGQFLTDYT